MICRSKGARPPAVCKESAMGEGGDESGRACGAEALWLEGAAGKARSGATGRDFARGLEKSKLAAASSSSAFFFEISDESLSAWLKMMIFFFLKKANSSAARL